MDKISGVLVLPVASDSAASEFLQANDVIPALNEKQFCEAK